MLRAMNVSTEQPGISCRDACGKTVANDQEAMDKGWSFLHISKGWRCGECDRQLFQARNIQGTPGRYDPDPLPPDSLGALKKHKTEAAHPVVKP